MCKMLRRFPHLYIMKITTCLVGSFSSGKSTLLKRYMLKNDFDKPELQPTIGMAGLEKHTVIDNAQIKNIIFDTAGQERFSSLIPIYLRNCDILIFTIDSSDYYNSFKYFKLVIPGIIDLNKYIVVCFTKTDLVSIKENKRVQEIHDILVKYNKQYNIVYTSSIKNINVDMVFTYYLKQVLDDISISTFDKSIQVSDDETSTGCCILS